MLNPTVCFDYANPDVFCGPNNQKLHQLRWAIYDIDWSVSPPKILFKDIEFKNVHLGGGTHRLDPA